MNNNKGFGLVIVLVGLIVIAVIGLALYVVWNKQANDASNNTTSSSISPNADSEIPDETTIVDEGPSGNYQAVYLNDGKLYFGELTTLPDGGFELAKIFYLSGGTYKGNGEIEHEDGSNVSLEVLYMGEYSTRKLVLQKEDVTKWEDMPNASTIPRAIQEYDSSQS